MDTVNVQVQKFVVALVSDRCYKGWITIGYITVQFEVLFEVKNCVLEAIKNVGDFRFCIVIKIFNNKTEIKLTDEEYARFYGLLIPFILENKYILHTNLFLKKEKGVTEESVVPLPREFYDTFVKKVSVL